MVQYDRWIHYNRSWRPIHAITQNKINHAWNTLGRESIVTILGEMECAFLLSPRKTMAGIYIKVPNFAEDSYEYIAAAMIYFVQPFLGVLPTPLQHRSILQIENILLLVTDADLLVPKMYSYIIDHDHVLILENGQINYK
jgi:hypothetical protein